MAATAIVVPIEPADPVIGPWRTRYTADGADDMPAHITLLYPWIDDDQLVAGQVTQVRQALARFPSFDFSLEKIAEFPRPPMVLYLAPEPAEPFIEMTEALAASFPNHPPYGGAFGDIVPHATIVETEEDDALEAEVRRSVESHLPIRARAAKVWIMTHGHDRWRMRTEIVLGSAR